ncbi:beta-phosphoglucomutase [Aetokthonos hydrillicola Thurmond2011]|jgi:kojibiose phosphorylase|uniref:Beta-phosphoglucomutase n=1 Tax=Aetokthonos hydrillicola Thurmond2011 TaxID=2712845 RepID=A0AAP5MC92_9CYAN|nr:beta-phosphoglucomutase [Aetokthonos hydrillicola]MBO3460325.1 beta-phosphoglucomutase [Aetokthonos hydrillicola CCALA 1050]MBW4590778.1 beta-phosphoglucomutase [Aetokthonos hydrillicola CCALA 1050]MDR9898038.1 beta-phosphoglucomutase [Aetokthonos hydrillicola Thurmond2011]
MDTNNFTYTDWTLIETEFHPDQLHHTETVFTIGNGYLGTRGSFEEGYPRALAATLIHGVYDDVPIVYTELANCPDWSPLIVIVDGDRFRLDQGETLRYERHLDLRRGILSRFVRWRSPSGKTIDLSFERFASLADQHVLVLRCQLTPVDFEGFVEVQGSLNGYPENQGFNHWELLDQGKNNQGIWLNLRTRSTRISLGIAAKMTISEDEASLQVTNAPGYPTFITTFSAAPEKTVVVEKFVTVFTSRDVENPVQAACEKLSQVPSYLVALNTQEQAWEAVWDKSDILIEGDIKAQLAVRYNLFQLLIGATPFDDKVSIPAKVLSGFGYRGHVFWDTEIFILPFFIFTQPELARNMLTYRYHTLNGARRKAAHYGYKGAMYSWESADTGDEVTPRWLPPNDPYGEDIRIWCRDREIHISADIAYAVWNYWYATGDDEWMRDCGAEIILDTAVFWGSRVEYITKYERYEIRGVIGADEYHEMVNNNAFTNRMVQWHLEKALLVHEWLRQNDSDRAQELEKKLHLTPARISRWQDIIQNIWIPYDQSTGLIDQFDGFFELKDINLADYEPRDRSMQKVLGIEEGNTYQVLKQPDVLMLLYLMRQSEEFPYTYEVLEKNWDYYAPRTDITYGSSLGPAIHAILASDLGKAVEAYQEFMQAAMVDIDDVRGNADEGIHGANAGGIWQAVVLGFGGVKLTENGPIAKPHLPPGWQRLKFKLHWRGQWHDFDLSLEQETAEVGEIANDQGDREVLSSTSPSSSPSLSSPIPESSDIQGVIFDLDGVLTDTAEYHYLAWQKLADEEGLPFNRQANEALRGVSRRESLLLIIGNNKQYTEEQIQQMMDRKNRYYVEFIENISPADLLPGALNLLEELRQAGIKTALGSASKNARPVIEKLGIAKYIDVIADGYSVEKPKPAPDLFLYAAKELGLEPAQCVVVEDAAAGVEAALAGGMWAVGLGPHERVGAAHIVLPSLAKVHWVDLLAKLKVLSTE